ncbi:(E3-independent) E2 ubiquitin-conjugating enzyme UBE2O-like [Tubulanus polymorphus]|uniref:(E3-independent) E2 ubiquitin-conjugating enzyme UBE2O-like n=1 Tax=Tubulanus polymorphus TaxID=672921 RepID=UPI003DA5C014
MAMEYSVFPEDEVYKYSKGGVVFGLLVQTGEFVSSDEEDENDEEYPTLKKGMVSVAWYPRGNEEVVNPNQLYCSDRSLMPGDSVRRMISGKNSQRGCVKDIRMMTHLQVLATDTVILNVDSKNLFSIHEWDFEPGLVTMDSWVGNVEYPQQLVTVKFNDGAVLQVADIVLSDFTDLYDIHEKRDSESPFSNSNHYLGQVLEGCWHLMQIDDDSELKWIHQTKVHCASAAQKTNEKSFKLTVIDIEILSVEVHWMCRGYATVENPDDKLTPPPRILKGDDIKKLKKFNNFEHLTVQIGDKSYYTVQQSDVLHQVQAKRNSNILNTMAKSGFINCVKPELLNSTTTKNDNRRNARNILPNSEVIDASGRNDNTTAPSGDNSMSMRTSSAADSVDEAAVNASGDLVNGLIDGASDVGDDDDDDEEDDGMDADKEDDDVSEAESGEDLASKRRKSTNRRTGPPTLKTRGLRNRRFKKGGRSLRRFVKEEPRVVGAGDRVAVEVLYTRSFVDVLWQDGTVETGIESPELYPVQHIDEQEFFPGDFVVRNKVDEVCPTDDYGVVMKVDHEARTCLVKWCKPYQVGKANRPDESIVPEEMSFYDLKEHPDYQFSPDQVVVRVGGYEGMNSPHAAAGQIMEVIPDGTIRISWADKTISSAYPQEIYYVNDEMSLGSSEDDIESDSEHSDSSVDSWQTEDEQTDPESQDDANQDKNGVVIVDMKAELKIEIDDSLDRARELIEKLELYFQNENDVQGHLADSYRTILRANKCCMEYDGVSGLNFFSDPNTALVNTMNKIKKEVRKEKVLKMKKQVMQLYRANTGCSDVPESNDAGKKLDESNAAERVNNGLPDGDGGCCDLLSSTENCENDKNCAVSTDSCNEKSDTTSRKCSSKQRPKNLAIVQPCAVSAADDCATVGDESLDERKCVKDSSDERETDVPLSQIDPRKAKQLCLKACHCLKEQIEKFQTELNRVWMEKVWSQRQGHGGGEGNNEEENMNEEEMEISVKNTIAGLVSNAVAAIEESLSLPTPVTPITASKLLSPLSPDPSLPMPELEERFTILETAPDHHRFKSREHVPNDRKAFFNAVKKEIKLLRSSLPRGIMVKGFEDRMDLYSVMIVGPANTPYEDGLFLFDVQLANSYPSVPPSFHYVSFCEGRLNPNLYEEGKVCVSLLGTWEGKGTELWNSHSNLLQVLVSIQGLILNSEPYYNEAGYDRQRGTQVGCENSKVYNEMAILKLVQSMKEMLTHPPELFKTEIEEHFNRYGYRLVNRIQGWLNLSGIATNDDVAGACGGVALPTSGAAVCGSPPDFPLVPASKGFCISVQKHLEQFKDILDEKLKEKEKPTIRFNHQLSLD